MGKLLAFCQRAKRADVTSARQRRGEGMTISTGSALALLAAMSLSMHAQAASPSAAPAAHPAMAHASVAPARALTEAEKIQALISTVEKSQGLQFIRNGSAHDPAAAANHLRLKWKNAGRRVHTAEDFIRYCATGSSMSGKPYQIRYSSGKTVNSADYFHAQLHLLEAIKPKTQATAAKS